MTDKIKVLWLCYYPPSRVDSVRPALRPGIEHPAPWLVTTAEAIRAGCPEIDLEIAFLHPKITRDWSGIQDGIGFHAVRVIRKVPVLNKNWPPFFWQVLTRFASTRRKLCRVVRDVQPDLVHAFGTESAFALAAVDCGRPFLLSMQGLIEELAEANPGDIYFKIRVPLEKRALQNTRHVIAPSGHAKRFINGRYPHCECRLIENPVSEDFFKVPPLQNPGKRLLFVGRVAKAKGIEELLAACANRPEWQLRIAGAGDPAYIESLKSRVHPDSRIEWLGEVPSSRIPGLLADTDLFVLPSYMESAGLAVQEAMAAGRPVVASQVGGLVDFVENGKTGLLVPPKSVEPLSRAIDEMLSHPERMVGFGMAARQEAIRRFRMRGAAEETIRFYKKIIEEA